MMPGMRGSAGSFDKRPAGSSVRVPDANQVEAQLRGRPGARDMGQTRRAFKGDYVPSGYREGQIQQYDPRQQQLYKSLFKNLGPESYLGRLAEGDESFFEEMEQPAWKLFGEAQGQLGSRYSQLSPGSMSAQRGSGFQNEAGQLGSDFAMNLSANRQNLRRQAIMDLMGLSNQLLGQRPTEKFIFDKSGKNKPMLGGWGGAIGGGLGGIGGLLAGGGPAGALKGATLGYQLGQGF